MKEVFKPSTDERPVMIVMGILTLYILIAGFISYFYFMHKISLLTCIIIISVFTIIYTPRFLIIKKLKDKDEIKILDNSILINNKEIPFNLIKNYKTEEKKPAVIFVFSNNLIVYNEATFHLLLADNSQITFKAIGSEKINLLKEFFNEIIL